MMLRLLADDLTGALDSAAMFATGEHPVRIELAAPREPVFGTRGWVVPVREQDAASARALFDAALPRLRGADVAFLKLDSLLRGPWPAAIAAAVHATLVERIVIAPAFPAMGRVTRHGQTILDGQPIGPPILRALAEAGIAAVHLERGVSLPARHGVFVADATTDADLARLAASHGAGTILWCGSAGLAQAVAARKQLDLPLPDGPSLAVIGSHHRVTQAQIATVAATWPNAMVSVGFDETGAAARIAATLASAGRALVHFALPEMSPVQAAAAIADTLAATLPRLAPPARLVAGGGETLLSICTALETEALDVLGAIRPGMPLSRFVGGRWHGVMAISKSGAFGDSDTLRQLLISVE